MTELVKLVRRAARHPHFADKYRHLDLSHVDFAAVPEMTREDVTRSSEQLVASTARPASAYLFTSGGSTAEPKLAWIPSDMYLGALLPYWQPLESSDVLANLAMPGRLWSAHYFYNRVAERAGADVIGLGSIAEEELGQWLAFLRRHAPRRSSPASSPTASGRVTRSWRACARSSGSASRWTQSFSRCAPAAPRGCACGATTARPRRG
jgi:phenylacetate-CoA ligase